MQPLDKLSSEKWIKICHINVRSLLPHLHDLIASQQVMTCDVISVSETWLKQSIPNKAVHIPGFNFYRRDRYECYKNHNCKDNCQMCNSKGGVGIYMRKEVQANILPQYCAEGIECLFIDFVRNGQKVTTGVI